jgi:Flp pilus assembly protein CpaB
MSRRFPIDRRTLLGATLAVVAAGAAIAATRPEPTTGVLVAGADLASGVALGQQSIEIRRTTDPTGLITSEDPTGYVDWVLSSPLDAGEPIPASLLRHPVRKDHPNAVALALDTEHAVLGDLRSGDRIDVFVTAPREDQEEPVTDLVAPAVFVIDVIADTDGLGAERRTRLLLAADRDLAATLIHATRTGDVDLVRVSR